MTERDDGTSGIVSIRERAPARPIRKDEIVIAERGLYIESWLPERRSRRKPMLLLHGELTGSWVWHRYQEYFAQRGWEGHALNLRAHYWSETADFAELDFAWYLEDTIAAWDAIGRHAVVVGHGLGGLLALKLAEQRPVSGLVLISPQMPAGVREPAPPHLVRAVPTFFRRAEIGWQVMPEQLRRLNPDLSIADAMRIQHLMGAESGAARQDAMRGVPLDLSAVAGVPALVIGGGLDRLYPEADSERLATVLGAEYVPFGAHSHFGLVAGDESHEQVADAIRLFLEVHKL
jgi:pimeloyl-ACP methyl ester carboxylesterase